MAMTDEQEAEIKAQLAEAQKSLVDLKAAKAKELASVDDKEEGEEGEEGEGKRKKLNKESPKKKIDADYAKSIAELQQEVAELKAHLKTGSTAGLRPIIKVD